MEQVGLNWQLGELEIIAGHHVVLILIGVGGPDLVEDGLVGIDLLIPLRYLVVDSDTDIGERLPGRCWWWRFRGEH